MDDRELRSKVLEKLNLAFGNDVSNLSKCYDMLTKLEDEKLAIEKSLSLASSEAPSKVSAAIQDAEQTSEQIHSLTNEFDSLSCTIRNQLLKVDSVTTKMKEHIEKIDQLEKLSSYLHCIKKVEEHSNNMETFISEKEDQRSVQTFVILCDLYTELHTSSCKHFLSYLKDTIHFWHNLLKDKYSIEFEEILKIIKWPFVGTVSILTSPPSEAMSKFQQLIEYLLDLQLPEYLVSHSLVTSSVTVDFPPLLLPITLLVRPLKKRFLYHFYGTRQTNRPDKPEWYFTQVLTWIRDHEKFVADWVQPIFNKSGCSIVSAKREFMRGLVQVVIEKLHSDMSYLQYDDALFSHTVDETLGFDRELRESYGYLPNQPSVLSVLTQAQLFVKWINMERKYALEKMDAMLTSETAWLPLGTAELDELRVTECGDSFLNLLLTITDRYSCLPQPGHRLQFLELQLYLLDDLRVRLLQLLREEPDDPLNSRLPAILNTISYLSSVLQEWGSQTHYLQLQFFKSQTNTMSESEDNLGGTVFDDILALLLRTKQDLIATLCEAVMMDIKARSREYRKDRWYAMQSPKTLINPSVTPSACPILNVLATKLQKMEELLAVPIFKQVWQIMANQLSKFIYEEVVLMNSFNEGGAMQLQFDMTRNLFPLFAPYTAKPELYFPELREACLLLNLPKGSALLLQESLNSSSEDDPPAPDVLADIGIYHLTPEKALSVIERRHDLESL